MPAGLDKALPPDMEPVPVLRLDSKVLVLADSLAGRELPGMAAEDKLAPDKVPGVDKVEASAVAGIQSAGKGPAGPPAGIAGVPGKVAVAVGVAVAVAVAGKPNHRAGEAVDPAVLVPAPA